MTTTETNINLSDEMLPEKMALDVLGENEAKSKKEQVKLALEVEPSKPWRELTGEEKAWRVFWICAKTFALLALLYIFVCSLDLLSTALQLLGGRATGDIFSNPLLENPMVGLMIGILVTVAVQSSSTSTSIVVSLVAAGYFEDVRTVIPIIMGANIGTSITNTLVAVTRINNRAEFSLAFAGATVHDMFNWLTVIVLLTVEVTTGYLFYLTEALVQNLEFPEGAEDIKLLKVITEPLTKAIMEIDKEVLNGWAANDPDYDNRTLLKVWCEPTVKCPSLFALLDIGDLATGAIMTVVSLLLLCGCLILLVKLLQNVLQGPMVVVLQKTINANIPYVPWLTGYLAILVGACITFVLQSSSVFTSALTPLVGLGVISVNRMYPLCLGSNIGTTTTAVIAALTASGEKLRITMQVAMVHLFFNLTGILIFYPIPFMRWPLPLCKKLGKTTGQYRWFAFAYLLLSFLIIPAIVLLLSLADPNGYVLLGVAVPVLVLLAAIIVINILQNKFPNSLPKVLQTWNWLPLWMRDLAPIDRVLSKICSCCMKETTQEELEEIARAVDSQGDNFGSEDPSDLGIDNKAADLI
ncbi:sodium-dependent phosphate transport protein 2B-like [Neocloeon triangulifer]|uniref:sodium-dependent phosphate transport protein 2B-like n=1 Tax=Neocloeon triangulifer TaxID=2078957 RepID=UPI00286ECF8B|nr:sodium-dependent phosphate transport protein 2B-like [Neocloeon triangulifer]